MILFSNSISLKVITKIFIRSIRISKDDPSLIQKHRSGLEKEEIINKNYDPFYVKTFHGYVRRKLPRLPKRSDKYFTKRPRWLYRIKLRSRPYYHTASFLTRRLMRYRFSARMAGRIAIRRKRIYLRKGQFFNGWFRRFNKETKSFGPWIRRRFTKYRKRNRYYGTWIKKHPNMVQFKKGVRQFKYFRNSRKLTRTIKRIARMRYAKRFRFTRPRRAFRFVGKLGQRRRLAYRYRRATIQMYSLRKFYRVFSLRRRVINRAKPTVDLWRLRVNLRKFRFKKRKFLKRFKRFKRLTKKVFKVRAVQSSLSNRSRRNALVLFKQLLKFKPEIRFGAKFKFKTLLLKPLSIRRLKKQIRSRKLKHFRPLRLQKRRRKLRFFSYKSKRFARTTLAYRVARKIRRNKFYYRRKLSRIASIRHYRHNIPLKIRRSKLHHKRLAYVSFTKALKKKNVRLYLKKKKASFLNRFNPFEQSSRLLAQYTRVRTLRAFKRYERLPYRVLRAYEASRFSRLYDEDDYVLDQDDLRFENRRRIRLVLKLQRRNKIIRSQRQENLYARAKNFKLLRRIRRLVLAKRKKIQFVKADGAVSLIKGDKSFTLKSKLLRAIATKVKRKFSFINYSKNKLRSYTFDKSLEQLRTYNLFSLNSLYEQSSYEQDSDRTYISSLVRKVKGAKLKERRLPLFGAKSLLYPDLKTYLLRKFSLSNKRAGWRKSLVREQYLGYKRLNSYKKFSSRVAYYKKRVIKRKRARILLKKKTTESIKLRALKHDFIKSFAKKLKRKMILLKKRVLDYKKRLVRSKKPLRRRLSKYERKRRRRFMRHSSRRQIRRKLRNLSKRSRRLHWKGENLLNFIDDRFLYRPKVHLIADSGFGSDVPQFYRANKRRLFLRHQFTKFLKKGLVLKQGFEYSNKRRFYEPKDKNISFRTHKSVHKRARVYKRLLLVKKRKVHRYRVWWNLKHRRYMHRRRFLSPKPKRRNKRFISHLPAVHIAQTNSNYFIYVIVNKQVIFVKSTGHCGFEGSKRKAPYAVEKLGVDVGNWLLSKNMRFVTLRPHFPKLFYVARLALKGMLKPYRLKPAKKYFHLRTNKFTYHKKPEKQRVEVAIIRRLLSKAHNGLRLPTRRRL